MIENSTGSLVLTANVFNPSIFTEWWMVQNNLLPQDNMEGLRIFSSEMVQFQTPEMQVLITPPKVQIGFPIVNDTTPSQVLDFLVKIINLLPHTPYKGLGLNFDYFVVQPDGKDFGSFDRELFGCGNNVLLKEFNTADARFGGYFSKNYGEARLKLDIKPVTIIIMEDTRELLQFSLNFHHDLSIGPGTEITSILEKKLLTWRQNRDYSIQLVNSCF
jgi:hypothetical protein